MNNPALDTQSRSLRICIVISGESVTGSRSGIVKPGVKCVSNFLKASVYGFFSFAVTKYLTKAT